MNVWCPHCEQKYEIEEQMLGSVIKCQFCDKEFVLSDKFRPAVAPEPVVFAKPAAGRLLIQKNKRLLCLFIILLAVFVAARYVYSEYFWQGEPPQTLAGYQVGGPLSNPSALMSQFADQEFVAQFGAPERWGSEFDICRLQLEESANGKTIKQITIINSHAGQSEFDLAVDRALDRFGHPNAGDEAKSKHWSWPKASLGITLAGDQLSIVLTKVEQK